MFIQCNKVLKNCTLTGITIEDDYENNYERRFKEI